MAAKPVDSDASILVRLASHAEKVLNEFVELGRSDNSRAVELLAELEHVISEFRRLRPPPTFTRSNRLWAVPESSGQSPLCTICRKVVDCSAPTFFQTPGAIYHLSCYKRAIGSDG